MRTFALVLAAAASLVGGCGGGGGGGTELERGPTVPGFVFSGGDVADGEPIDARFTCDGENASPALAWEGVPVSFGLALALEDLDAPGGTFTHWLVYGMDRSQTALPRRVNGAIALREGENDFGETGYGGPCPPEGEEHRYVFRLFALHAPLELESGADREAFDEAIRPHVLAEARLTATYARS
jgi:Raf kinase inhibitor-like YbhB/YbcL family protein